MATNWPTVHSPDHMRLESHGRMILTEENQKTQEKNLTQHHFIHHTTTWTDLGTNPGQWLTLKLTHSIYFLPSMSYWVTFWGNSTGSKEKYLWKAVNNRWCHDAFLVSKSTKQFYADSIHQESNFIAMYNYTPVNEYKLFSGSHLILLQNLRTRKKNLLHACFLLNLWNLFGNLWLKWYTHTHTHKYTKSNG